MDDCAPGDVIDMAALSTIAKQAARTVLLASVLPMCAFYLTLSLAGLTPAIVVTLGWYYAGVLRRVVRRRPVAGALLLGAGLMSVRAAVAMWTGSAFVFFLQPVAGTVATATCFALTALAGRPLFERLAHDFVPVPPALSHRLRANGFFDRGSLLWALMYGINAAGTVWLLTSSSLGAFLLLKTVLSPVLTGATVALTYLLLRRSLRRDGVRLRWGAGARSVRAPLLLGQ
ncbi:MAG: VC0807 family protein [Jatrophihabitantaceae bacterium]